VVRPEPPAHARQHHLQAVAPRHAFDTLGCKVVGLRTDNFNFRSQRAIEALGAKRDVSFAISASGATARLVMW